MRIWDLHCHPEGDRVPGRTFAEKIDNLIEIASRMGIERLNMFLRVGETVSEKEVVDVLKRYPDKLSAFLWMTLWKYTIQENIDKVNRLVADGPLVGIKLAGGDGICSLPVYDPIFERAAQHQSRHLYPCLVQDRRPAAYAQRRLRDPVPSRAAGRPVHAGRKHAA